MDFGAQEAGTRLPGRTDDILTSILQRSWIVCLALFLIAFVPRVLAVGAYVTVDEEHWIARSVDFVYGMLNGDLSVIPSAHPGVTALWGFGALLLTRFVVNGDVPALFQMRTDGYFDVPGLLPTAAMFTVLVTSLTVVASYLLLCRLAGRKTAFLAALLIAVDPYFLTHSRRVHLDAILASMMYLSALSLLVYVSGGSSPPKRYLVLSGVFAGLATLTKVTAVYLVPFSLLALAGRLFIALKDGHSIPSALWRGGKGFLAWAGAASLTLFLLWPAMWVGPAHALSEVARGAAWGANVLHGARGAVDGLANRFFMGEIVSDPGLGYYPVTVSFRLSPVTLVFFPFSIVAMVISQMRGTTRRSRALAYWLGLAYVVFFVAMMSLGAKKLESYVLPVFPMVDTLAAIGIVASIRWIAAQWKKRRSDITQLPTFAILYGLAIAGIFVVSILWLRLVPHYAAYFNPLLGGPKQASRVYAFGGGEGMADAARYLNEKDGAENLVVSAPYDKAVFRYYFLGTTLPSHQRHWTGSWLLSDFVISYLALEQRQQPSPEVIAFLGALEPEYVVRINGIDYAKVYEVPPLVTENVPPISHPAAVDLDDKVTFLGYDLETNTVVSGGEIALTLYWQRRQPLDTDYSVYLRLVNGVYDVWGQQDGGPLQGMMPTSRWDEGMVIADPRRLQVLAGTPPGTYEIAVGMYDPATLQHLEPMGQGGELLLGPVEVGRGHVGDPPAPQHPHEANLDDQVRLLGYDLEGKPASGGALHLALYWETLSTPRGDYTVFVHLVGADGRIWAQKDSQPVTGFYPTSMWNKDEFVRDQYDLTIPAEIPSGEYTLSIGMYEPEQNERLRILDGEGTELGDSIDLGTIQISQ